jgi:diguanylate cyclase (GGDEF)-like protein
MNRPAPEEVPQTFRRIVLGILLVAAICGWAIGVPAPSGGLLLMVSSLAMGASFYGRTMSIPGAVILLIALRGDIWIGVALAATMLIIGERTHQLRHRLGRFAERSFTDRLTGLFNYDFLQAQVRYEVDRVRRYGGSCSLMVMDLDFFKRFNDTHGHQAGNLLLRALADTIRVAKRDSDFAARYGGEEFVVLVPGEAQDAMRLAERIRQSVEALRLPQLGPDEGVTISIGIASFPEQATNAADLFERADQAVYHAKHTGKNRVVVYPNAFVRQRKPGDAVAS